MVLLNIRDKIIIVSQPEINRFALHLVLNINIHIHIIKVSLLFLQYTHLKKEEAQNIQQNKI